MLDTDSLLLRWFNHWLKDSGEFNQEPRVRHFVLGETLKGEEIAGALVIGSALLLMDGRVFAWMRKAISE